MAALIKFLSLVFFVFILTRISFNAVSFTSCGYCVANGHIVEACNATNFLTQHQSDEVNTVATLFEAINSVLLFVAILCWKKFHPVHFLQAIFLVGHFWMWFALVIMNSASALYVNISHHGKLKSYLAIFEISELTSAAILACAINFIDRSTIKHSIGLTLNEEDRTWKRFVKFLYDATLLSYVFRNLGLFLYDTTLVAMSVSLSSYGKNKQKDWSSFLLVMDVALRGTFAQFFFAKFFQGRPLPRVSVNFI